jgi:hypothetical protein
VTFGDAVTEISEAAFLNAPLTSLTISASVTSIGNNAFGAVFGINNYGSGNTLQTLVIETSVPTGDVFTTHNALTSVTFGDAVTEISDNAFLNAPLTSLTIPAGVTSIGDNAFENAPLTSLTIPAGITSIGDNAFENAPLVSLTIPAGVTSIGINAFYNAPLVSLTIPAGVTSIGNNAFGNYNSVGANYGSANTLQTLVLETSVPTGNVFRYHEALTSVTFGDAVTEISDNAFYDAPLVSLTIPASVTSIGINAFYNAPLVSLTIPASVTSIGINAFGNSNYGSGNTLQTLVLETSVPTGNVFRNHNALTSVTFGDAVTEISDYAFFNAPLTSLTIPNINTIIGQNAFAASNLYLNSATSCQTPVKNEFRQAPGNPIFGDVEGHCGRLTFSDN